MSSINNTLDELTSGLLTPLESFYRFERETPEDVCFVQPYPGGKVVSYTWRDVGNQVRSIAAYLQSLTLPAGSNIALMSGNCAYWIMADIAIWMAGHCSVPLYPNLSAKTIRQIIEHSDSKIMFVGKLSGWDTMAAGIPEITQLITFPLCPSSAAGNSTQWADIIDEEKEARLQESPIYAPDNIGTIIYTSGTTGMPKGVMHSFRNLAVVGQLSGDLYNVTADDSKLSYLPLAHAAERASVEMSQLYHGYPVYFSHSLETFADDLRRASPTLFFAVPRIWNKLQQRILENVDDSTLQAMLNDPQHASAIKIKLLAALGLSRVRVASSGAAPLSTSLIEWFKRLGIEILEGYAMSENLAYSHTTACGEAKTGFVGTPNPYVECKLSEEGEVLSKSPCNMIGYYKEPALTAGVFDAENFLRTGDLGVIDDAGRLRIIGRTKELFKTSKGKYVAPAPIENSLSDNLNIESVCVTGANLPQAIALVSLSEQARESVANGEQQVISDSLHTTLAAVNQTLDQHENISHLIVVKKPWTIESGLLTPTLKVKRCELENQYCHYFEAWQASAMQIVFEI